MHSYRDHHSQTSWFALVPVQILLYDPSWRLVKFSYCFTVSILPAVLPRCSGGWCSSLGTKQHLPFPVIVWQVHCDDASLVSLMPLKSPDLTDQYRVDHSLVPLKETIKTWSGDHSYCVAEAQMEIFAFSLNSCRFWYWLKRWCSLNKPFVESMKSVLWVGESSRCKR